MQYDVQNPLIVQSDKTILLDVHAKNTEQARNGLIPFAELEKSPEHLHTYKLSPLSLWNAATAGVSAKQIIDVLQSFSRFPVPRSVESWIVEVLSRFGKLKMLPSENPLELKLSTTDHALYMQINVHPQLSKLLLPLQCMDEKNTDVWSFKLALYNRGTIKQLLLRLGWPVEDEAPLLPGESLPMSFREKTLAGKNLVIRDYQKEAAKSVLGDGGPGTGFGTIVLPCGAGKTIVGMTVMSLVQQNTLILTTNISAVHQWINELLDKTTLDREQIGEYTGECKNVKPVTIATYQILTWRTEKNEQGIAEYPHFNLFREHGWGLIIYDEVHLLPAPVFRVTAELQTVKRVGLTATLVREDGCEGDVFSLVGPKRYDVPWKDMEVQGWIAQAICQEIRVDLKFEDEPTYAVAPLRKKHRIASENSVKLDVIEYLLTKYSTEKVLIIGQYIDQLQKISERFNVPLITGKTNNDEREVLYDKFRKGDIHVLVVSKVANFAIDLPDASMAIQVSGTFGSRQEEAQRLGRILRPKERNSLFFSIITRETVEEQFSSNRQKFLAEQGYTYTITQWNGSELEEYSW